MRSIILFTFIVLKCCIELHCLPLPAGQIIKYRVSSKYFNRNNETTSGEHSRESLYNLLTQIHYGDATQFSSSASTTTIVPATVREEDEIITETTTNEAPEEPTTQMDVTEQQQDTNAERIVDKSLNDLIQEFMNAGDDNFVDDEEEEEIEKIDSTTVDLAQPTDANTEAAQHEVTESEDEIATTTTMTSIIDSEDHDSETKEAESSSTIVPTHEELKEQPQQQQQQHDDDDEEEEDDDAGNEIPESLLSAVGDLLSSVLGITVDNIDDTDSENFATNASESAAVENETLHAETTESSDDDVTATEHSTENQSESETMTAVDDSKMTEVDEKIGNLNVQNTFMTESAPEIHTEAETVKSSETEEVLEVLVPFAADSDATPPVSIEDSVNHVINLVKGATQNADVYTTLKEIGTSLGLTETSVDEDELKALPISSFDRDVIKNFETDINDIVSANVNADDHDNFVSNDAKAALYHEYQYSDDF